MDDGQSQEPAAQVGRPRAPQRRSPSTPPAPPAPRTAAPDAEVVPQEPSSPATALRARPPGGGDVRAGAARRATRTAVDTPHLPRGAGEHFQPVPHALLVAPHDDRDGSSVTVPAPSGTPVHAVCAGTVREAGAGVVRIAGDDGFTWEYAGVGDLRVPDGQRVDAGGIIGVLRNGAQRRHALGLSVRDRQGAPARLHEVLRGAVDPNELGYGAAGTGVDIDPDAHVAPRSRAVPGSAPPADVAQAVAEPLPGPAPRAGVVQGVPEPRPEPAPPADVAQPTPEPRPEPRPPEGGVRPVPPRPRPVPPPPRPSVSEPSDGGLTPVPPPPRPARPPRPAPQPAEPDMTEPEPARAAERTRAAPATEPDADAASDEQPPERSGDEQRRRAAMLIANRRGRPRDTGSSS